MKFSIIIPVNNTINCLQRCADSILNQTVSDWECILVDDGSTDGSGSICNEYAARDSRYRVFHTTNRGVSSARNLGIDNALGDFILFVDSDDSVPENYLDTIEKEIEGYDLLVFSNSVCFNSGGKNFYQLPNTEAYGHKDAEKCIFSLKTSHQGFEFFGYIWNKCYRREIIETNHIRFCSGLSFREDNIFNEHYYCHINSIKTIPDILYHYSFSETGLTHKQVTQMEYMILAREYNKILDNVENDLLYSWNAKKVFDFMINSSLPFYQTSFEYYNKIRRFVKLHPDVADSIKYKSYFLSILPIGFLCYYFIEWPIFIKNILKRR